MQRQQLVRQTSGGKAIALDGHAILMHYRSLQLLALILTASFALSLHLLFGR